MIAHHDMAIKEAVNQLIIALEEAASIIEKVGTIGIETRETNDKARKWLEHYFPSRT